VQAIKDALPTSRHARMLFDMTKELLGERAHVETAEDRTRFTLFTREAPDSDAVVPWPLLEFDTKGRIDVVIPIIGSAEPPPRPGSAPKLRNLHPGQIELRDGPDRIALLYGDDGRWNEVSRGGDLGSMAHALERGGARPVELLAEHFAALDLGRHGPGRVVAAPLPPAIRMTWTRGLHAIRDALFLGRIPKDACWAVADGYEGIALGSGATRAQAMEAWRDAAQRARAAPPRPTETKLPEPRPGAIVLRGPKVDGAWPDEAPAVRVELVPGRRDEPRRGTFVRMLGSYGGTSHALLRRDDTGFTLVGEDVLDEVDLDRLDAALAGVHAYEHPEIAAARAQARQGEPDHAFETIFCRVRDPRTGIPIAPEYAGSQRSHEFLGRALDGDKVRSMVVRHRGIA